MVGAVEWFCIHPSSMTRNPQTIVRCDVRDVSGGPLVLTEDEASVELELEKELQLLGQPSLKRRPQHMNEKAWIIHERKDFQVYHREF